MTDEELVVVEKAIRNLSVALIGKTTKTSIQALVWFTREELIKLTKTNLDEPKNVHHEKECGK